METETPPVLTRNLTKRFRRVTALDSLDLRVEPGDVLALLGANGSGKSTTFRLLMNIYRPSEGEASLLGTPSKKLNGHHFDRIGYISEGQTMPKWMSVEGFLKYCSGFYNQWDAELCQRLVTSFGLPPKQKIKHLSRGQAMKVAVASTVPAHPDLLLLDEPFSGLDVETRAQLSDLLKTLAHQDGLAIIITTHDVEEVEPVANRLAILSQGRLKVNEALADYLSRHRLLLADGLQLDRIPEELRSKFNFARALQTESKIFTEHFDTTLESTTITTLSEKGLEARFAPMNIRQILTAHSLPVT
jgi:ABC-2 type transport system ATP-binding protein